MRDTVIVLSRRTLVVAVVAILAAAAAGVLAFSSDARETVGRTLAPRTTADPATLAQQRSGAEHSIQRGYVKATEQLRQVRELRLAISLAEADAIDGKARADLRDIRRQALGALAAAAGTPGVSVEQYVTATEAQLDQGRFEGEAGLLLAPGLMDIVRRADELFTTTADEATRQLTRAPSPSPRATPSPTP